MIEPNIYCKVCGMAMQCIADFYKENKRLPVVLEIGCADGQGTMRYAGFCDMVICVDPMQDGRPDLFEKVESKQTVDDVKLHLFQSRTAEFNVHLVTACSLWPSAKKKVQELLKGRTVDVLIVDGCHHPFEAVWGDFETYRDLVTPKGFVVFDDLYEDCILEAYNKAQGMGYVEHERWSFYHEKGQDAGALRAP